MAQQLTLPPNGHPQRRRILRVLGVLGILFFELAPLGYLLLVSAPAPAPMYRFSFAMNSPLLSVYPIIAVALFLAPYSALWRNGYVRLQIVRSSFERVVLRGVRTNAVLVGAVFAFQPLVTFAGVFWCAPALGVTGYVSPAQWGDIRSEGRFARLTQLMDVSPWAFILVYSLLFGLIGAALALFGHLLLAGGSPRLLALSAPAMLYLGQSILTGLSTDSLTSALVPFGLAQMPISTLGLPLVTLGVALGASVIWCIARRNTVLARI